MHLSHKLENVACTLEGEETSSCWHTVDYLCSDLNDLNNTYNNSSTDSYYDNTAIGGGVNNTNNNNSNRMNFTNTFNTPTMESNNGMNNDFLGLGNISGNINNGGAGGNGPGNYVHNILDSFDNEQHGFNKFF